MSRLSRLSPEACAIAALVSLVPGRAERWLLARTVGDDANSIDACLAVGMVAQEDGSVTFRHELARRAVEENIALPRRRDLHARILQALRHRAERSRGRAFGAPRRSRRRWSAVIEVAPRAAARAALLGAHRETAAHYETALLYADGLPAAGRAVLQEKFSYDVMSSIASSDAMTAREAAWRLWRGSMTNCASATICAGSRVSHGSAAR